MTPRDFLSRRNFLTLAGAAPLVAAAKVKNIPISLELYSVRQIMNPPQIADTLAAVAKAGYQYVEFYGPYFGWTTDQAKEIRKVLDGLNLKCTSTHNGRNSFEAANHQKAIDLNSILGSKLIVMASAGKVVGLDGWKKVAADLDAGCEAFKKAKIGAGYHNHQTEFRPLDGTRPIEVIAKNTKKAVTLQFDIGTCLEAGQDPVAWINQNPGRIRSIHCKDWSADKAKGYRVLLGEGDAPWKQIFAAAEKKGGVETYVIEQEGYSLPPIETVQKCLENMKKLHV